MLSSIQQSCPRDDSVSLLGGPLDLVRQNNFPVPHSHTSEEDSEWKGSPASVFLREMVGWGSLRKILLPGLWKIRFPRRKPMFNLAQRQLRLSLWGTELANRSTCRESKPAKEALSDTMLGIWTQAFLNCHFCHFVRRAAAQVYILCFLHAALRQLKEQYQQACLAVSELHSAVWQSDRKAKRSRFKT